METTKIQVAISSMRILQKPTEDTREAVYGERNKTFESMEIELIELANYVYLGHSYTNWHAPLGQVAPRKHQDFWLSSQLIVADFDAGTKRTSLSYISKLPFVERYGFMGHETMSSTSEKPRSRFIFRLSQPITDKEEWKRLSRALISCFDDVDRSSSDVSHAFLGSPGCEIVLLGKTMPLNYLRYVASRIEDEQATTIKHRQPQAGGTAVMNDKVAERNFESIIVKVKTAASGNRNHMLNWAAHTIAKDLISQGLIPASTAQQQLLAAAEQCGLERREATLTIHSGFTAAGVTGSRAASAY